MNYKDLWTSHSHRINADDSEKYMDEEDFKIAILEWESAKTVSRVELPVKPEIAEIKALIKEAREGLEWFQQDWINKSTLGDGINWATRLIYKLKRYE